MTIDELESISNEIKTNSETFFTNLEAHKMGYDTPLKHILSNYNQNIIINHSITNRNDILLPLISKYGLLTKKYNNIPPSINPSLYYENVVFEDIDKSNLNNYLSVFNMLTDKCQQKCYSMLGKENMSYVYTNNIEIPIKYINPEIKLSYIRHMLNKPSLNEFLVTLNDSTYIYRHYSLLKCEVVDRYLMANITYFNDRTVDNLVNNGIHISTIYKYHKDISFKYILNHIKTISDLKMILNDIPEKISIEQLEMLYDKFPKFKYVIDKCIIRKINE